MGKNNKNQDKPSIDLKVFGAEFGMDGILACIGYMHLAVCPACVSADVHAGNNNAWHVLHEHALHNFYEGAEIQVNYRRCKA